MSNQAHDEPTPTREVTITVPIGNIRLCDVPPIAAKLMDEEPVSRQTVYSWVNNGKRGAGGEQVYLETKMSNGFQVTTYKMIETFVKGLQG